MTLQALTGMPAPPRRRAADLATVSRAPRYAPYVSKRTTEITPPPHLSQLSAGERAQLERRARLLAWGGNAWHLVEFGVALGAGLAAGSIALIAFGATA